MQVTDRLLQLIREKGWSKKELSIRLPNCNSNQQLGNWFKRGIPENQFLDMAHIFGVNEKWLRTGLGDKYTNQSNVAVGPDVTGELPLISWVQAGAWSQTEDPYQMGQAERLLPAPTECSDKSYILRVRGASMEDEYFDGELIYVDPTIEPKHNDDVVVRLNNSNDATFKRLQIDGDRKYLIALNKQYPDPIIPLDEEAVICGVVFFSGRFR